METEKLASLTIEFENWHLGGDDEKTLMVSVYGKDGGYIGQLDKTAIYLLSEKGILPEKANDKHSVCSIGKSLKDGKWYGWSHRAIFGFEIGDEVEEGSCAISAKTPVGFKARTENDCKEMAIAFANCVG